MVGEEQSQSKSILIAVIGAISAVVTAGVTGYFTGAQGGKQEVIDRIEIPVGMISFFNSENCPDGWRERADLAGRYVVGLRPDSIASLGQTQGQPLENLENRSVGDHSHRELSFQPGGSPPPKGDDIAWGGSLPSGMWADRRNKAEIDSFGPNNVMDQSNQVPGTNAPYILMLGCEKT